MIEKGTLKKVFQNFTSIRAAVLFLFLLLPRRHWCYTIRYGKPDVAIDITIGVGWPNPGSRLRKKSMGTIKKIDISEVHLMSFFKKNLLINMSSSTLSSSLLTLLQKLPLGLVLQVQRNMLTGRSLVSTLTFGLGLLF